MIKLDFFSTYVDTGEQKWNKNGTNMAQEWNKNGTNMDWDGVWIGTKMEQE
jgi:hypothetical protein